MRLSTHMARRIALSQTIQTSLEQQQLAIFEENIPEARVVKEREGALYDSTRDYLTQNYIYQAHKADMNALNEMECSA